MEDEYAFSLHEKDTPNHSCSEFSYPDLPIGFSVLKMLFSKYCRGKPIVVTASEVSGLRCLPDDLVQKREENASVVKSAKTQIAVFPCQMLSEGFLGCHPSVPPLSVFVDLRAALGHVGCCARNMRAVVCD